MRRTDAHGAGSESRRPSSSWALPSSAVNHAGASSSSNGKPGAIACGQSSRRSRRSCDGACISRSPNRDDGWRRSSGATSPTTPCRPTRAASALSATTSMRLWLRTLRRRSQKDRITWERIAEDSPTTGSRSQNPSSLAAAALCRQTLEVGAGCRNWARPGLCGGRWATPSLPRTSAACEYGWCATVREMKEGPSGSAIRSRSQATASCCGQEPWW